MTMAGKVALVTGGSRGIGAAVARRLAADGAAVAIVYRHNRAAADLVVSEIESAGGNVVALRADVADAASATAAAAAAAEKFGRIDILAHVAGVYGEARVGEISRQFFDEQFLTNTWSLVTMTQAVLPHFPREGGSIVAVSTSLVHEPGNGTAVYSASKAALENLTLGFAKELGARGIRVNAVAPAITRTDMTSGIPPAHLSHETALTPLNRLAEPADVADVIAFLASNEARWVTGRTLLTDGGRM